MTVAAIDAELVSMNGVREENGLDRLITDIGILRGEVISDAADRGGGKQSDADQDATRQLVGPLWKNIRHSKAGSKGEKRKTDPHRSVPADQNRNLISFNFSYSARSQN